MQEWAHKHRIKNKDEIRDLINQCIIDAALQWSSNASIFVPAFVPNCNIVNIT